MNFLVITNKKKEAKKLTKKYGNNFEHTTASIQFVGLKDIEKLRGCRYDIISMDVFSFFDINIREQINKTLIPTLINSKIGLIVGYDDINKLIITNNGIDFDTDIVYSNTNINVKPNHIVKYRNMGDGIVYIHTGDQQFVYL